MDIKMLAGMLGVPELRPMGRGDREGYYDCAEDALISYDEATERVVIYSPSARTLYLQWKVGDVDESYEFNLI